MVYYTPNPRPRVPDTCVEGMLGLFGADPSQRQRLDFGGGWDCYSVRRADGTDPGVQVILVVSGPRNLAEIKKAITADCVVIFAPKDALFLRALGESCSVVLQSKDDCERVAAILRSRNLPGAEHETEYLGGLLKAIETIPVSEQTGIDNRGVFSNHYLKDRLWDDLRRNIDPEAEAVGAALGSGAKKALAALGWKLGKAVGGRTHRLDGASVIVVPNGDLSVRTRDDVAPSYTAVAELKHSPWVILTNGTVWRLYTSRISASTTNYFEIDAAAKKAELARYLAAIFGAASYSGERPQIEVFFEQSALKARKLQDNLRGKILRPDGLFLDIVKGILDHDMEKRFSKDDLEGAKETALAVMYRVWFILYAESRNLLPVRHTEYAKISLLSLRAKLDAYEDEPDGNGCWKHLLGLFGRIKDGSPGHNLPQYDGELFKRRADIDQIKVRNRFIARALRDLLETDGEPVDYGDLGVRHLGNIYEALLGFGVRQTDRDIMLLEDGGGVREVDSKAESTYSYKKNDLYLASKGGIMSRKTSASFYTPDEIVAFLVQRGLDPLLREREAKVPDDVRRYKRKRSEENRRACIDRLLDLQVVDPAMGSGHFLVEALNQITRWATEVLNRNPGHPLVDEIEQDRKTVIKEQKKKGITIDESLLTADVLLKRRVMKRCIFGVDLNGLAVELARLSLWLDSFAIGVPLTYLNHHIRHGDSTIGSWIGDLQSPKNQSLDSWLPDLDKCGGMLERVSYSPDITVSQAAGSKKSHEEYEEQIRSHRLMLDALTAFKMDQTILPKKARAADYLPKLGPAAQQGDHRGKTKIQELVDLYTFFHWELEMMDAFTDSRRGFDLVVGNPPWEKSKPSQDEFFTPHDPNFKYLKPDTKKKKRVKELLEDTNLRRLHEAYIRSFKEKASFYKTCQLQGSGDKDLWQLVLERVLNLVSDGGIISVLVPSQILSNTGSADMRRRLLGMDVMQAYVFENRKKIFDIHSSYRFALLTVRNQPGPDEFPAAFYLHHLASLEGGSAEGAKFTVCSKQSINKISPADLAIPEVPTKAYALLAKLSVCDTLGSVSNDGWQVSLARGFDTANDADLFREDGRGWPVFKGKDIHQFNPAFGTPDFTADKSAGLRRLEKKRVYVVHCRDFHESHMIVFRDISGPANMRTMISSIIPPHTFHAHSLNSIILTRNHRVAFGDEYNHKLAYLTGILNSMTFDFIARAKIQMHTSVIFKHLFVPNPSKHDKEITNMAAMLTLALPKGGGGGSLLQTRLASTLSLCLLQAA